MLELIDHLDRQGMVVFPVSYTTHLGPVRAAEALARFEDRVSEISRKSPQDLCVIRVSTPDRARPVHAAFSATSSIASVDSATPGSARSCAVWSARRSNKPYGPACTQTISRSAKQRHRR